MINHTKGDDLTINNYLYLSTTSFIRRTNKVTQTMKKKYSRNLNKIFTFIAIKLMLKPR